MYLYVLQLEGDYYYVGIAKDLTKRLIEHFAGTPQAAKWTNKHKPVSVIHHSEIPESANEHLFENAATRKLAKRFGWEKVRGGSYSWSSDHWHSNWDEYIRDCEPADMDKMNPIPIHKLFKALKYNGNVLSD